MKLLSMKTTLAAVTSASVAALASVFVMTAPEPLLGVNKAAVKIVVGDRAVCSGTNMGDGYILTAHHCFSEQVPQYDVIFQDGSRYTVSNPLAGEEFKEFDIAVFFSRELKELGQTQASADLYCAPVPIGTKVSMQGAPGIPWYSQADGNLLTSFGTVASDIPMPATWAKGMISYIMPNIGGFSGAGVMVSGGVAFVNSGVWAPIHVAQGALSFGSQVKPICDSEVWNML